MFLRIVLVLLLGMGMVCWSTPSSELRAGPGTFSETKPPSPVPSLVEGTLSISFSPREEGWLYAGTRHGLYLSSNHGGSWRLLFPTRLGSGPVRAFAFHPDELKFLYLLAGSTLFISLDKGIHWARSTQLLQTVHCVAVVPAAPSHLLIGTSRGVRISLDRGLSWIQPAQGSGMGSVQGLVFHPQQHHSCFAVSEKGLFRSDDSGTTWDRIRVSIAKEEEETAEAKERQESKQDSQYQNLAIDPTTGELYLGTDHGVYRSHDNGSLWQGLPIEGIGAPRISQILPDPNEGGSLYAATSRGVFHYSESDRSWRPLRNGFSTGPAHAIALDPDGQSLWIGADGGLFHLPLPISRQVERAQILSMPSPSQEPSVQDLQQAAIRYGEVMPEKIRGWRTGAAWRNWLPKLTLQFDRDKNKTIASSTSAGKTTFTVGPEDQSLSLGLGFTWDLANFIWNPDQISIDTRSRLMVELRQDLLEQVTRIYFERRRLLAEFHGHPTDDPVLIRERSLRIEELTAQMDALTGGWFSKNSESH